MEQRASKMVDAILSKQQAEPLPAEVQQALGQIVEREQARLS